MTRRKVKWWSRLAANPQSFIKSAEGKAAVEVLTEWWIEAEGIYQPGQIPLDGKGRHLKPPWDRYTLAKFYRRLEQVPLPPLRDSDEVALDKVFEAFYTFTTSRKARKLAERSADQVRAAISRAVAERPDRQLDPDLLNGIGQAIDGAVYTTIHHTVHDSVHHSVHDSVHHAVHQSVHDSVHSAVHSSVHSAVHSAVHDAGCGGHSGGGGGHH